MAFPRTDSQSTPTANPAPTASSPTTYLLHNGPPAATYGATTRPRRPTLLHAQNASGTQDTSPPAPTFSRPLLTRADTTTTNETTHFAAQRTANRPIRPSLLKRISSSIDSALELSTSASQAHRNRPAQPSHWTDHAHRAALLATWDSIRETAGSSDSGSKSMRSLAGQLQAAEQSLVKQFPELAEGEVVLSREWVEYVLGVSLRHPFCAEGRMGRWEVLAGAAGVGGARAWGHW